MTAATSHPGCALASARPTSAQGAQASASPSASVTARATMTVRVVAQPGRSISVAMQVLAQLKQKRTVLTSPKAKHASSKNAPAGNQVMNESVGNAISLAPERAEIDAPLDSKKLRSKANGSGFHIPAEYAFLKRAFESKGELGVADFYYQ